jgi:TolA-binding protein
MSQADRDQIRQTLYDADLSDVWLRSKVQQLLDQADEQAEEIERLRGGWELEEQAKTIKRLRKERDYWRVKALELRGALRDASEALDEAGCQVAASQAHRAAAPREETMSEEVKR